MIVLFPSARCVATCWNAAQPAERLLSPAYHRVPRACYGWWDPLRKPIWLFSRLVRTGAALAWRDGAGLLLLLLLDWLLRGTASNHPSRTSCWRKLLLKILGLAGLALLLASLPSGWLEVLKLSSYYSNWLKWFVAPLKILVMKWLWLLKLDTVPENYLVCVSA